MKKTIALFLSLAAVFSATAVAAKSPPVTKPKSVTMTIPSSYSYVYDRLVETLPKNDYFDGDILFVEEEIVMEAPLLNAAPTKDMVMAEPEAPVEEAAPAVPQSGGSGDYSKTNTQVEGIDEADLVKTDGKYIYVLKGGSKNKQLVILSAGGKESAVISKTDLSQPYERKGVYYRHEMYLAGKYVVLLSEQDFSRHDYTMVELYDVSDPASPKPVSTLGQEGYHNTSRLIGSTLYVLTTHTVSRNDLNVESNYDNYIPHLYKNGTAERIDLKNIVIPPEIEHRTYTIVTAYNLETGKIRTSKAIITPTDTVYMSGQNLYLADEYNYEDVLDEYTESVYKVTETVSGRRTTIYKMSFADPAKIVTKAVGTIDGVLLNQFSMDEYKGNLRVVTTHSSSSRKVYRDETMGFTNTVWKDSSQTNGLYVFNETMDVVGSITGLAEDERVYSVRFTGDVGYFVTFRETDPLFAVDLSDPANPKIMSELKIPGFSEYLHPYADGLLFGLGQDADAVRTYGLKLSMFDTSNPYDVTEKHKLKLDAYSSEALNNHKAIFISAKHGMIGFPVSGGYALYGYDAAKGFCEIATVAFDWSWSGSRGLYVGEYLYVVLPDATVVMDLAKRDVVATVEY